MKSRLIEIAGVCVLLAFASSGVLAQSAIQGGPTQLGNSATDLGKPGLDIGKPGLGTFTPLAGPWTTDNVAAARPFGNIDVSNAGTSTAQVRTWSSARTPMERNELSGRCGVINDPDNGSRYPENAQAFCRTFLIVAQGVPAPTTKY